MAGVGVWKQDGSAHLVPPCSPEVTVGPTGAEPVEPAPILPLSGGSAIGLLLAGPVGVVGCPEVWASPSSGARGTSCPSAPSTDRRPLGPHGTQSSLGSKTAARPTASSQGASGSFQKDDIGP